MLTTAATARLARQLHELPEILVHAYLQLVPSSSAARGGHVSGATRTPPLPCNLAVLDALTDRDEPAVDILESWACTILDDRARANDWTAWVQLPAIRREMPASTSVKVIAYHLPFAARRAYAVDLAAEIDALHHHLDRIARHPIRSARPVRTPCPECRLLALCERTDGWRECLNCRAEFDPAAYDERARQLLTQLGTAA